MVFFTRVEGKYYVKMYCVNLKLKRLVVETRFCHMWIFNKWWWHGSVMVTWLSLSIKESCLIESVSVIVCIHWRITSCILLSLKANMSWYCFNCDTKDALLCTAGYVIIIILMNSNSGSFSIAKDYESICTIGFSSPGVRHAIWMQAWGIAGFTCMSNNNVLFFITKCTFLKVLMAHTAV